MVGWMTGGMNGTLWTLSDSVDQYDLALLLPLLLCYHLGYLYCQSLHIEHFNAQCRRTGVTRTCKYKSLFDSRVSFFLHFSISSHFIHLTSFISYTTMVTL